MTDLVAFNRPLPAPPTADFALLPGVGRHLTAQPVPLLFSATFDRTLVYQQVDGTNSTDTTTPRFFPALPPGRTGPLRPDARGVHGAPPMVPTPPALPGRHALYGAWLQKLSPLMTGRGGWW